MRTAAFLTTFAVLLSALGDVAAADREITTDMALRAVIGFREADPMSEDALGYAGILITFVEKDKKLRFTITPKAVPFLGAKGLSQRQRSVLLGAYAAGNVHSCLLRGDRIDDPYAGDLQVIETYRRMQKAKPRLRIPEIEKLIELERRGELKKYVSSP